MRYISLIALILFVGVWPGAAAPVAGRDVLVRFKTEYGVGAWADRVARDYARDYDLDVITRLPRIDVYVLHPIDPLRPIELSTLNADRRVAWAEFNGEVHATATVPNDVWYAPKQAPQLQLLGLPAAWDLTRGAAEPLAFVDTGVDLTHPDLINKLWHNAAEIPANSLDDDGNGYIDDVRGWNFVNNTNTPQSSSTHGSHVAGLAAAETNNTEGVAGVNWQARILPLRALADNNTGTITNTAAAIIYAADNGARVINLSLGTAEPSNTLAAAVTYAQSQGCLLIASTGNDGLPGVEYPAALPGVLAVGASTLTDGRWSMSNYGAEIDLVAPGENVFSTARNGGYAELSGTSMSTAYVSGVAALVWAMKPHYTAAEVAHALTSAAHDIGSTGWDAFTGWGRLDAARALRQLPQFYLVVLRRD